MKRKEFKKVLNEVVLEIFERKEVNDMLLMDVKRELGMCERINELMNCYNELLKGKSGWMFFDFDDRCVNPRIIFTAFHAPHPSKNAQIEYIYKNIIKKYIFQNFTIIYI
jgi:hypothetical protein